MFHTSTYTFTPLIHVAKSLINDVLIREHCFLNEELMWGQQVAVVIQRAVSMKESIIMPYSSCHCSLMPSTATARSKAVDTPEDY